MKRVLIAYFSLTGNTEMMAQYVAEGVRFSGQQAVMKKISDIKSANDLADYDGYIFGSPTYYLDAPEPVKTFLFLAQKADLPGKAGGAFGSYTHIGSAPEIIHNTLAYVFRMNMMEIGPFNVKEQILDSDRGAQPCRNYGKAVGGKLTG